MRLVKRGVKGNPVTLAIGDGANDVAMIQEAQIGIGISGKEGRQAVNSSDFAIAQFKFLKRLLLVHGRSDYVRLSKVVLYSFYKNVVLAFTLFFFVLFSGMSGQSLYDDYLYSSYNFILFLPVFSMGIFDKDISFQFVLSHPMLYYTGRERKLLNIPILLWQLCHSVVDAIIIFFVPYMMYDGGATDDPRGKDGGIFVLGTIVFSGLILSMIARSMFLTSTWNAYAASFTVISVVMYFAFIIVYQVHRYTGTPTLSGMGYFIFLFNHNFIYTVYFILLQLLPRRQSCSGVRDFLASYSAGGISKHICQDRVHICELVYEILHVKVLDAILLYCCTAIASSRGSISPLCTTWWWRWTRGTARARHLESCSGVKTKTNPTIDWMGQMQI